MEQIQDPHFKSVISLLRTGETGTTQQTELESFEFQRYLHQLDLMDL